MAMPALALGVNNPQIDTMNALGQGLQAGQAFDSNQIKIAQQGLETIGSIALGAMGGKMDGQADPKLFEEGLDYLAQNGVKVDAFRGRADLAPMVAQASMTAMQQLQNARSEQEYQLAMRRLELDVQKAMETPNVTTGLNPVYGVDGEGNPVVMQPRSDGSMAQTVMPEGVTIAKTPIKMDTGTEILFLDPITRQVVSRTPKENFQQAFDTAAGTESGKATTQANLSLPGAIATAEASAANIDALLNDPNLGQALGIGGVLPAIPNTDQAGVVSRIDQIKGRAFLEAFESLKGAGQITEIEGQKATQAIARLDRVQNEEDFKAALRELKGIISKGVERAKGKAGAEIGTEVTPQGARRLIYNPDSGELE